MNRNISREGYLTLDELRRAMTMRPMPPPTIRQRVRWRVRAGRGWLAYKIAPWTQ